MGGPEVASEIASVGASISQHRSDTPTTDVPVVNQSFDNLSPVATNQGLQERYERSAGQNAGLPALDTLTASIPRVHIRTPSTATPRTPRDAGLHVHTDITAPPSATGTNTSSDVSQAAIGEAEVIKEQGLRHSQPIPMTLENSLRSTLSAASIQSVYSLSPGSGISSPAINALPDITPLPSPLQGGDSPTPWKSRSRPGSSGSLSRSLREEVLLDVSAKVSPTKMKQKSYGVLTSEDGTNKNPSSHQSSRSISDFRPGALHNEKPRNVTTNAVSIDSDIMQIDSALHREKYLAEQRGLVPASLPTPPPSNRSVAESEADEVADEPEFVEYLVVREGPSKRKRKYRPVRPLGQGTFSKVVLATSERLPPSTKLDDTSEAWLNPKNLVAIKVVQHGPAGGADAERIDLGLKREIEILRTLEHPTLIHLKAFDWSDQEALIVLNYCAGGDLFDLASQRRDLLTPHIVQRMFAELVDATRYLHSLWIVHRDIKLENVLLNLPAQALAEITDAFKHPYPLITLTDLGLSRKIPQPPESPLLQTRCGSEDYAAPEILLGQPYDGRKTDAWALGVLTYALMEGRLPFDPPPVRPGQRPVRGKSTHRIARCDWMWCEYGDEYGEWDPKAGAGWEGARECVEGLLKKVTRGRVSLDELAERPYVKEAIDCEGGLRRPPHADDEDE
ncbi:uncharacterized protein PV09_06278 [Verruconis gallopava]|uniref:Protein kinase domain-containing protein n=1 Tax=Verruconis gallopava TaxID=253628 RepID=A0A0D1YP81_9PEZI|nr:uncharacterized protein PV09_06278 [Verruconis gallopava]KIW02472.1 hypothetical protein PV09_06278 [Verruconis gallopava]